MKRFFQISSILLMTIFFFSCSNLMRGETGTIVMELPSEVTARVANHVDGDIEAIRLEVSIFDKDSIEIETQKKDIDELNFDESKNNSLIDANFSFELDPGSYKAVVDFIYPDSEDVLFSGESDYFEIIAGEITPVTVSIKQYYDHFVSFTNSFDLDSEEDVETPVESIFRFVKDGYKLTIPEYMFELEENSNFEYWFDLMELNEKLSDFLSNVGNITIDDFNEDSASNDLDLKNIYSEITKYMPGDEVVVTKDIIFAPLISPSIVVPPVTMYSVSFTNGESIITKMMEEGTELQDEDFPEIESERKEEFLGWFDENGEKVLSGYKVTSDVSITAKYEEKHLVTMYSVSFTNGESIITKMIEEGTELQEEDFPEIESERIEEFLGWFDENGDEVLPGYKVTSDVSIAAKYEEKHLVTMLSVMFTNGAAVVRKTMEEGTELQEEDFPKIESERIEEFLGWYDENGEEVLPGYKVTSDISITAKYEEKLEDIVFYDVTADMPLEIKQNIDNQNYANVQSGTKIKLIAPEGAEIKYLKTEDGGSSNWYTYEDPIVIEKDCRISASYKIGDLTSNQIDVKFSIFKKASANVVINYAYKGDLVMEVEEDDYSDVTLTVKSLSGKALKSCTWMINDGVVTKDETFKDGTEDIDLIKKITENTIFLNTSKLYYLMDDDEEDKDPYHIVSMGHLNFVTCIVETEDGDVLDIQYTFTTGE